MEITGLFSGKGLHFHLFHFFKKGFREIDGYGLSAFGVSPSFRLPAHPASPDF